MQATPYSQMPRGHQWILRAPCLISTSGGAVNVSLEAVCVFREINSPPGGLPLQNSCMAVFKGIPLLSYYGVVLAR
ncbi:hypothetical protein SCP_1102490 [Sparassis crispa]|uniref:Uncharacterized protein n=1 Tax=Sparassis crispa TaxID=139825 RepID=A0A401GZJ3_9APHY|nr:hypothetical protein SCP_1102490 [Sparassis crispa]GBE87572.1 hypothetical protein SCP_1102490 [Sparassis crispa]